MYDCGTVTFNSSNLLSGNPIFANVGINLKFVIYVLGFAMAPVFLLQPAIAQPGIYSSIEEWKAAEPGRLDSVLPVYPNTWYVVAPEDYQDIIRCDFRTIDRNKRVKKDFAVLYEDDLFISVHYINDHIDKWSYFIQGPNSYLKSWYVSDSYVLLVAEAMHAGTVATGALLGGVNKGLGSVVLGSGSGFNLIVLEVHTGNCILLTDCEETIRFFDGLAAAHGLDCSRSAVSISAIQAVFESLE